MILLLGFAFLSGLVTILAPCIWPLLPIILSSSAVAKSHAKPLGITIGIMLSFAIFTLTVSSLVRLLHFDPSALRLLAVIVIGFLGLTMIIPKLSLLTEGFISKLSGLLGVPTQAKDNDFKSGLVTGLSLGIVWSPCAGPILAAIATLAATSQITLSLLLITVAYVAGVGIPLFAFAYGGQQLFVKTKFISSHTITIQKIFGVVMILTALAIYTNYDKTIQVKLLGLLPEYSRLTNQFENNDNVKKQLSVLTGKQRDDNIETNNLFNANIAAPEFVGVTKWLNTPKDLTLKDLRGKVVLVDFWTYTCINCIRTLPHVTTWYENYKDKGFVVVGVHTPEFEFEKEQKNVEQAIKQYNIHYPVAQDNNYATWNAYKNQYWPAEYLIDQEGKIRRTHFGEGEYEETEKAIQALLEEKGSKISHKTSSMPDETPSYRISPETYLGSKRMQYLYPQGAIENGTYQSSLQKDLPLNSFSFGGEWIVADEQASAGKNAVLEYNFLANKVFLVMHPPANLGSEQAKIKVYLDGKIVEEKVSGEDVKNGVLLIDSERLYNLVNLHEEKGGHILRLEFLTPGIQIYAFTFG